MSGNIAVAGTNPNLLGRYLATLTSYNTSFVPELVLGQSGRIELEGWDRTNLLFPVKIDGKYNAAGVTLTDGQRSDIQLDQHGMILVNQGALSFGTDSVTAVVTGAANLVTSQPTPAITATTLAIARPTRTSCTIINVGSTQVYVGPATVTAANGILLAPGASIDLTYVGLIQGISIGSTGLCHVADEYN